MFCFVPAGSAYDFAVVAVVVVVVVVLVLVLVVVLVVVLSIEGSLLHTRWRFSCARYNW